MKRLLLLIARRQTPDMTDRELELQQQGISVPVSRPEQRFVAADRYWTHSLGEAVRLGRFEPYGTACARAAVSVIQVPLLPAPNRRFFRTVRRTAPGHQALRCARNHRKTWTGA